MAARKELLVAAGHYAAQSGLDERMASSEKLQALALALSPQALKADIAGAQDAVDYVRAVLTAARPGLTASAPSAQDASRLAALRLAAYCAALGLLGPQAPADQAGSQEGGAATAQLTERQAAALVSVLDTELSGVTGAADLAEIAEESMAAFESDSPLGCAALELLPKALALLQAAGGEVEVPNGDGAAAACQVSDVCKSIIGRVCQHAWPLASIAKVLASLRSFPLTADTLKDAVQRATLRARHADAQDLPAVVHQLLMMSTRGCRELILQEVMALFEQREAAVADSPNQRRQLMELQGIVLLHIDMAAKHDMELGQAWLRQLRGEVPPRLSAFSLAVCFTLAGIQRFEQPVTDALKSLFLGAFKDASVLSASPWLPTASSSSNAASSSGAGQAAALSAALLQCARNSAHGQGGIVQPMVQLAVALIEAGGSSSAGFGGARGGAEGEGGAATPPGRRAAALGARLLLEVYESQRDFRRDIIRLCHNSLIGAKEEVAAPFIRLLAQLVRRNAATIGDHMKEMKVSLEHLIFLPPNSALALLLAVWPICRTQRDAQDYIVMLLRKAMFSRELHARLLAARGFLYLITQELRSGGGAAALDDQPGPSQATMSQLSALSGGGGATLLHEVMSFLRRCLTQQPEVRRVVYDGMPALLVADPSVQDSVVEPLLPHFLQFYEQDEQVSPPLKLEACARIQGDGVRLVEPLQHLLAGVSRVLLATTNAPPGDESERPRFNLLDTELLDGPAASGDDASATGALRTRFATLRRRLADATIEHFNLDASSAEFGMATAHGQLGYATADVLLGCMEVAMEDYVQQLTEGASPGADSSDEGNTDPDALGNALLELFGQHTRLVALATEGAKKSKKADGGTQAAGGARRGPGRPTAAAAAGAAAQAAAAVVPVDRRVPVFSLGCLAKLLDAIADDGFQLPQGTQASMGADTRLCREPAFPGFALSAALRQLQAAEASELTAAIATGTAGSEEDSSAAGQLFGAPDWRQLSRPLFRAVQTVVLSHCKQRPVGGVGGGNKKEKEEKEQEAMTQVAVRALQQLLSMGAAGGAAGLAAVCERLPDPTEEAIEQAGLPSFEGLSAAQRSVAARLPLLHEMFSCLIKPSCGRELEALCGCLSMAAEALPPAFADKLADWAVAACRELSNLTYPGAAKALLSLALRGRSAAVAPPPGQAPMGGAVPKREPGCGDDLDLLLDLAADVKQMMNADEEHDGDAEGQHFAALNTRTLGALLAAQGAHLDSVLSNLEWAFGKLRAMAAAAHQLEPGSAQARLAAHRTAWERAALGRLRKVAEIQVLLAEARLTGTPNEALIKSLIRTYKLLGAAAKGQLPSGKGSEQWPPSTVFIDLVSWVNKECTTHVYALIQDVSVEMMAEENEAANEDGEAGEKAAKQVARKKKAAANRAKRESKNVPNLIFQIEEFERLLIRISKTGKCNLMQTARRATNRDFRVKTLAPTEDGGEGEAPRAKRHKRQQQQEQQEQQDAEEEEQAEAEGEEEGLEENAEQMETEYGEEYEEGQGEDE